MSRLVPLILLLQCAVTCSYSLSSGYFDFRGHPIHYEVATASIGPNPTASDDNHTPILLLNGFGVGSFHQHKLVHELMEQLSSDSARSKQSIYCLDYLGQGKSWPKDCNDGCSDNERGLGYSGMKWVEQITEFIETVMLQQKEETNTKGKVHIVGNSVGGHLAVCVAARRPDLVESLCLLNATPVWGLDLPGWDGKLPAPEICRLLGRTAFDWIRDVNTIRAYLKVAYHNENAVDDELIQQIRSCTEGKGGHAAFASIMWSSPVKMTLPNGREAFFDECLGALECDVLLLFGRDDPWCKPAFAKRMLQDLMERHNNDNVQRYVELSNVGHCPNHEAPIAVATVLNKWLSTEQRSAEALALLPEKQVIVSERWGETIAMERSVDEISLSLKDKLATAVV